jgi:hypothetical protein
MKTLATFFAFRWRKRSIASAFALLFPVMPLWTAGVAQADSPVTMAPPVSANSATIDGGDNASQDTVFNWREVPAHQQVKLVRAVFDKGGYQLYDTVGETIVVPFANKNLYVMKFAPSSDRNFYFVNDGSAPTLYVPKNGFLENASVPGARWYPFGTTKHPAGPQNHTTAAVFLGIAPSWADFIGVGWYSDSVFYGGYYTHGPFVAGALVTPTFGLTINIGGGHPFYGWRPYQAYVFAHPSPYRIRVVNNNFYRFARRSYWSGRTFHGGNGSAGSRVFHGGSFHRGGNFHGGFGGGHFHGGGLGGGFGGHFHGGR